MPSGMPSLSDVFRVIDDMRRARVFAEYAIGGATAVLFYAEPTRTYDLDCVCDCRKRVTISRHCLTCTNGRAPAASLYRPST